MSPNDLVAKIQERYAEQVEDLRARLASPDGRNGPGRGPDWRPPFLGPLRSVTDRHVDITLGADIADYAWYASDQSLTGDLVTVSIAGHHRMMRARTAVKVEEADAWALSVLGPENAGLVYRAGAVSGVSRVLTTVYYHLYRDGSGAAALLPAGSSLAERSARMSGSLS